MISQATKAKETVKHAILLQESRSSMKYQEVPDEEEEEEEKEEDRAVIMMMIKAYHIL